MKRLAWAATAAVLLSGCVVRVYDRRPAPPPPPPPRTVVTVSWGWNHHRYVVWREYYACTDDELYYLESCGYDDDDILVGLYIARRARVPLRYVFYEYDRCGRNYYAVAMSFRLPWDLWYCREIPRGYHCPPTYARAYGYYWRGERHYCSNDEIYALVHLQIGIRYYGYTHTAYFADYDACVRRGDRTPFRTIVIKDHKNAGRGGRGWDEGRVVVRNDRPWNHPTPQDWEKRRQTDREQVKIRHTPDREREEAEQARRAAEARKDAREDARRQAEEAKARRIEDDRKHEAEERARGPKTEPPGRAPDREPGPPGKAPDRDPGPPAKGPDREPGPPGKGPDREPGPPAKGPDREPGPPGKGPDREPGPPAKGPDREPGPPAKGPEKNPGPPAKGPDREPGPPSRGPEKKADSPAPPPRQPAPPPREPERGRGPEKRNDPPPPSKGPEKAPPPSKKGNDDSRKDDKKDK